MIRFADILVESPLPLHSYFTDDVSLSIKLIGDYNGEPLVETPFVKGDLTAGKWRFSDLHVAEVDQNLTVMVIASKQEHKREFVLVPSGAETLFSLVNSQSDGRHKFNTSESPIEFNMSCSIKTVQPASDISIPPKNTVDSGEEDGDSYLTSSEEASEGEGVYVAFPSREELDSAYAKMDRTLDPDTKSSVLSFLGRAYFTHYQETHQDADLDKAVSLNEEIMQITTSVTPVLAENCYHLGEALKSRFIQGGQPADVEKAILCYKNALSATDMGDSDRAMVLVDLAECFEARFQRFDVVEDLDQAIRLGREATQAIDGHVDEKYMLNQLGNALHIRFKRLGRLVDVEDAIATLQKAVELTPNNETVEPYLLSNLGNIFQTRFEHSSNIVDLDNAISRQRKAVDLTPNSDPDKLARLHSLGNTLQLRFERFGALEDLDSAISSQQLAIEATPDGHPIKPAQFGNLGSKYQARFDRLGTIEDLEQAISNQRCAIKLTPDGQPNKPAYLNNLGIAFLGRFKTLGKLKDLQKAISSQQQAVKLTPDGHVSKPTRRSNLEAALLTRFKRLGNLEDLEKVILSQQKTIRITPDSHPDKPSYLANLGVALQTRFEHLGSLEDLGSAISSLQEAIKLAPDGNLWKPSHFNNLGIVLQIRFVHLGTFRDLESAISSQEQAVELTPGEHPDKPAYLTNLGEALRRRFERLGALEDAEGAILTQQKSVKLTPKGHPEEASRLNHLGMALLERYRRFKSLKDLQSVISSQQRAVDLTPDSHPNKPAYLCNLEDVLRIRFERLKDVEDLENAISYQQKAVELTPHGHPNKPAYLLGLGEVLLIRFKHIQTMGDLDKQEDRISALLKFEQAVNSPTGSPKVRFNAALRWAHCAEISSVSPLPAFECAINLLPRIAWLGIPVADQHTLLAEVGGAVRDAVAAAIKNQQLETAVEWAEQGRSIVWQNLLGLRTPLDTLRASHSELADKLQNISRQLESPPPVNRSSDGMRAIPIEDVGHKYSRLAVEWDSLVEKIRLIPEFNTFLRPRGFNELAHAAYEGPIVILNEHTSRCDALVLLPETSGTKSVSIINIQLEKYTSDFSKELLADMKRLLRLAGVDARCVRQSKQVVSTIDKSLNIKDILRDLWLYVVKPVIDALAYQVKSVNLPRVWWCATGSLSFLPIHAAGLYDVDKTGETISDYVVSSYTPTLAAILDQSQPIIPEGFQILTVAEPSKSNPIPKTEEEVKLIQDLAGDLRVVNLMNENATIEIVLQEMKRSHWIHLACHGKQDLDDSMKSGFLLHGDKTLTLSEIVRVALPKIDFAFLSACQTATGDERVAEESVHLAAGMLLSGCRGVIATMWSIQDEDGPKVTKDVYSRMLKDGRPDRKDAAFALHEAVKRLRDEPGSDFLSWVPFIHIGR